MSYHYIPILGKKSKKAKVSIKTASIISTFRGNNNLLMLSEEFIHSLKEKADKKKATHSFQFFQAFEGGYGEGDQFLGIKVPDQRQVAKKFYKKLDFTDYQTLISNPYHEIRLTALMALVYWFEKEKEVKTREEIYNLYLANTDYVNNWDLVDSSSRQIVGGWLLDKEDRSILYKLAHSSNMWEQRISIIATYAFIKQSQLEDTMILSKMLLNHTHDLMHKAVGWMLRELGKVDKTLLLSFLKKNYSEIPRTMLRYAIEKFDETKRKNALRGVFE